LTASYSGFVNGDDATDLDTAVSLSTTAVTGSNAGTYPITASAAADANYTVSFVAGTLTVNKAALTVTADDKSKTYGSANPGLTASYSGFVNGDDATDLDTAVSLSTTAVTGSNAG
uniref:MBG domain-containing protein n=1 Tax=uncultured Tenacibaculum sp. TaxID=174713 RepID=UPI0026289ED3